MKTERRRKLKRAVLLHIANTISNELLDWDNLEEWLSFEFKNEEERDVAANIFIEEMKRLYNRINT